MNIFLKVSTKYIWMSIFVLLFSGYEMNDLKYAAIHIRHGHRAPAGQMTEDKIDVFGADWPIDYGTLTDTGAKSSFLLGRKGRL